MRAVGLALVGPALGNSGRKVLKRGDSCVPVDASVGDGDALLKAARTLRRHFLVALVDVGLDHDADNASLAVADLFGDVGGDLGLVAVVLVGVTWK